MKNKKILKYYTIPLLLVTISCANPVSPTGGSKDQIPPSIKNYEISNINNQKKITIQFDENIVFQNNIDLSPYRIKTKPIVTTTRNSISIILDSNTNSINFNDAIKDLNEGNKANLSNIIIGTDSSIKYYKVQSIPKTKEKIVAYSTYNNYIYPYNTSIPGYAFGEGLPNNKKINTTLFLDQNKNLKYDSFEWCYFDSHPTFPKIKNQTNDSLKPLDSLDQKNHIQIDTLEAILYPPLKHEVKYFIDSNYKKSALIITNSRDKNLIKKNYKAQETHNDTLIYYYVFPTNEIEASIKKIQFKNSKITINKSNKISYYQYISENDTLYFEEKCLGDFNTKTNQKTINNTDTLKDNTNNATTPILDMSNPFTNPFGSPFNNITINQNIINLIQDDLDIHFISYIQLQKQLQKEYKNESIKQSTALKPKELKKLSSISIQNDSNFTTGLIIYKEGKEIITTDCKTGIKTIILPVGNYQYFTWKDENNDQMCNQPEEILEYFFEIEVVEKIENTIIVKKNKIQDKKVKIPAIIQSE